MFIHAIIIAVAIGYILKGRLKNLEQVEMKAFALILVSFILEFLIVMLIKKSILQIGTLTCILDIAMYLLIFVFTFMNRKNKLIFLMGIGFLLNAIPIFLNGGAMPVSSVAFKMLNSNAEIDIEKLGLYTLINQDTKLWILGDIIPFRGFIKSIVSIGDIIAALGMMSIIITGMKKQSTKSA
jgi:hypothetical protein